MKKQGVITIGLFGTCGNSKWREPFIEILKENKIEYFNPVTPDWKPEFADIEAEHLIKDEIILFPVTDETHGFGSLSEVGFSINQAIKSNSERFVIIYVAPNVSKELRDKDVSKAVDSDKSRALVLAHLRKQSSKYPNVYIVESLQTMLEVMMKLYSSMTYMVEARKLCLM